MPIPLKLFLVFGGKEVCCRPVFPQLFRVLSNFQECLHKKISGTSFGRRRFWSFRQIITTVVVSLEINKQLLARTYDPKLHCLELIRSRRFWKTVLRRSIAFLSKQCCNFARCIAFLWHTARFPTVEN